MDFVCHLGTPEGRVVRETRAAANETVLRAELERQGLKVFAHRAPPRPRDADRIPGALPPASARFPYRTLMVFNQELAALLKAGLPLLQALNLMLERMREPNFREILTQVRDRVKGGEELSDAFASFGAVFPPLYSATLKAGERTGELEQVLRRFIRYLKLVIEAAQARGFGARLPVGPGRAVDRDALRHGDLRHAAIHRLLRLDGHAAAAADADHARGLALPARQHRLHPGRRHRHRRGRSAAGRARRRAPCASTR